jgi:uncharacterized membrane protein
MKNTILYLITYVFCIALDLLWLRVIATNLYINSLWSLLRKQGSEVSSNIPSALLVYAIMTFGILYFVVPNDRNTYLYALINGAIFGVVTYGISNCTNYALLANWPLKISIIDFSWGILLCTLTSCFALSIRKLIS